MLSFSIRPHRSAVLADSAHTQKLFLALKLWLDPAIPGVQLLSSDVALAIAVDTSGSMYAKLPKGRSKIDRAIDALRSMASNPGGPGTVLANNADISSIQTLSTSTSVSVIQFDHRASVLMPLTSLNKAGREQLDDEVGKLRNFGGGTSLALALELIEKELDNATKNASLKGLILTDGETTDEEECLVLIERLAAKGMSLICIGIGSEYNEDFLAQLAEPTNGFLYHLSESEGSLEKLKTALNRALVKSQGELVHNVKLRVELAAGLQLTALNRVYPMVQELQAPAGGAYRLGNVSASEHMILLAEIDLPKLGTGETWVGQFTLTGDVPSGYKANRVLQESVFVRAINDPDQAGELDEDVIFYVRQARISQMADKAVQMTRQGRLEEARDKLIAVQSMSLMVGNRAIARSTEAAVMELATSKTLLPETAKAMKVSAKTLTIMSPPTKQDI